MGRGPSRLTKSVASREARRGRLGLEQAHLFAHSYGGPPGKGIFVIRASEGVRSLVLSNSFASVPGLAAGWARHLGELSESARPRSTAVVESQWIRKPTVPRSVNSSTGSS